jgi:hypothetical protein
VLLRLFQMQLSDASSPSGPPGVLRLQAYHGTNQVFDRFDPDHLGLANPNGASRAAVFLAMREDTARDYALKAARTLVPDQRAHEARVLDLLVRAEKAGARGLHALSEALYLAAEDAEAKALQAPLSGARILVCEVELHRPLRVETGGYVPDLARILESARQSGHDGVILAGICDTPSGLGGPDDHVAVFDPAAIRILEARPVEPAPDPSPNF